MSSSNSAMCIKTKAMFAKRLREADYISLINKKNLAQIVSQLKNNTYFDKTLDGINDKSIRRGQLEILIKNDLMFRISRILKFANDIEHSIYRSFIVQTEIHLILSLIHSYYDEDSINISKLPVLIEHQLSFDLKKVGNTSNYTELLNSLKGSPYYEIIKSFSTKNFDDLNFVALEKDLYSYYYKSVEKTLEAFKGEKANTIKSLFGVDVELNNISKIYRLKKYFKAPSEVIREMIHPFYYRFNKGDYDKMILESDPEAIITRIKNSSYQNYLSGNYQENDIDSITKCILYNINKKMIFFSDDADVVVMSYFTLAKTEIQNIIDIIEGVRYGIDQEVIKKMLVY